MGISRRDFGVGLIAVGTTAAIWQPVRSETKLEIRQTARDPIQVNPENSLPHPILLLQVNEQEGSDVSNREKLNEYAERTPVCVSWTNLEGSYNAKSLTLTITNLGVLASDAVRIQYQFVYCVDSSHKKDQGFKFDHAFDAKPSKLPRRKRRGFQNLNT